MTKMIYKNIPIEFVSKISKKEANSKKPIYKIHKWFGRKTDAIFRSILLSLELDKEEIGSFTDKYYEDNHDILKGKVILDPFMGGGVTLVNTLRLGGKAIGIDINPVAWFITKNELQLPILDINKEYDSMEEIIKRLEYEFAKLEESIGREIKNAYTTTIYDYNKGRKKTVDIMYVFWIKKVKCPKCGKYTKLFPSYNITKLNKKDFKNYNICPKCGDIVRGNENFLSCSKCGHNFLKDIGNYKGRNFICSSCNEKSNLVRDVMRKRKGPLISDMYAIQYYDSETKEKGFKVPDKEDLDKYNEIRKKADELKNKGTEFIPKSKIPQGYNTKQIQNHNYKYWYQMFNDRQLYCLSKLLEEINKITNSRIKELFLCIFSNTVNANNMFCIYNSQCGKIEPLFGDHHMAPVINPVENNVWGTRFGRGTFMKYFRVLIQSKQFNDTPYERLVIDGKNKNIILKDEKFSSQLTNNFEELVKGNKNAMLKCGSAENLSFLPSNSVHAVITDPPYYSAINYGEISEFFYTWARLILKNEYDVFKPEHILSDNEVTVNEVKGITKEQFIAKLSKCFKEIKRVLKENSPMILTYNSSYPQGWHVLMQSIINAGFIIEKTYPIHTEFRAGLIDNRRDKMNYDLVIVAKAKNNFNENSIQLDEFLNEVQLEFERAYLELNDKSLSNLDMLLIRVGKVFEAYSKRYNNIYREDSKVSLKELLEYIYQKSSDCNI